jgi:hypothetical protein
LGLIHHLQDVSGSLTVDNLGSVVGNSANQTLILELADSDTGKGTIKAKTVDEDGLGNELVGRNFLENTFVGLLVKDNHVVCLVLDLLSRPLLLGLLASR